MVRIVIISIIILCDRLKLSEMMVMIAITDAKDMGRIFRYAAELSDGLDKR